MKSFVSPRHLIVFAAALAVIVVVWMLVAERTQESERALFPELTLDSLNDIHSIEISEGDAVVAGVRRADDGLWRVPGHHDHPADILKIRQLLSDLQSAEKVEQKTSSPEHYATLGVADPQAEEGGGLLLTLGLTLGLTLEGETLEDGSESLGLIIGNPSQQVSGGRYVRKADEAESWLVNAEFEFPVVPAEWLDRDIVHVEPSAVSAATVTRTGGKSFTITRGDDGKLTISDLPKGRVLKDDKSQLKQIVSVADYLQFKSVFPRADNDISLPKKHIAVEMTAEDGLVLTIKAYKTKDDKVYLTLDVGDAGERADELKQHLPTWLYEVPNAVYDNVDKRLKDFLKEA